MLYLALVQNSSVFVNNCPDKLSSSALSGSRAKQLGINCCFVRLRVLASAEKT